MFWVMAEIIVPICVVTLLFWLVVVPLAQKKLIEIASSQFGWLEKLDPCDPVTKDLVGRLKYIQAGLKRLSEQQLPPRGYIIIFNTILLVVLALIAIIVAQLQHVSLLETAVTFGEVLLLYGLVILMQMYFIYRIASKYLLEDASISRLYKMVRDHCFRPMSPQQALKAGSGS